MTLATVEEQFRQTHSKSQAFFQEMKEKVAGGVNGNLRFYQPFPLTFQRADGAWLTDLDGHRYLDYLLSYGALILGHGHPMIKKAVQEVWNEQGTSSFGAPHALELEMVNELMRLYPSLEELRFTNSGLEATLLSLRLALAYTGKTHVAKFEGHYHGSHDHVLVSVSPEIAPEEMDTLPRSVADSLGLPDYYLEHTVVLPFNDWDACESILSKHKDEIGAVILEPMLAGYIPADLEFLRRLRTLTRQFGIVLIYDEVKTGFRVAVGGAQEYYGVQPDLTALGKVVGGGFPIGVVGGKREIMELSSPLRSSKRTEIVFHSGTFNGNPVSLAAGLATIRYLKQPGTFQSIVDKTMELRKNIDNLAAEYQIPVKAIGVGTIFNVAAFQGNIENYRDLNANNRQDLRLTLDYLLMNHGVYSKPLNRFSLSAAHGPAEIQATLTAFEKSFSFMNKVPLSK